ncbi:MAG: WD40/YVTN/BNR-like repeat-containing protein [Terriglobia bacterium]
MKKTLGLLIAVSLALISLFIARMNFLRAQAAESYSAPRLDSWRILGPGGGGAQFFPAISPHDSNLVLVACDMTGAYISEDGGASWRMFNLRSPARFFEFDPLDPKVIYVGARALWRSADRGRTWSLVYPLPDSVTRLIMPDDHAGPVVLTAQGPSGVVTALAVDPSNSKQLYTAITEAGGSALYVSDERGGNWRRATSLPAGVRKILVDPRSPGSDRTLYVLSGNSVSICKAGTCQQGTAPEGVTQFADASAGFSANGQLNVYAIAGGRREGPSKIFVSHDGGVTWTAADDSFLRGAGEGASRPQFTAVGSSLEHGRAAYVAYEGLSLGGKGFHGVAKTLNGGSTWELVWKEADTPASNVHDAWITERFGTGWGEPGLSLGVSPKNPEICFQTDFGRTLRTTDGGKTWDALYSHRQADGSYISTGLDVTTNYGIFWDPFDSRRVFIAYTDIGLFRSENGGESWRGSTEGVPRRWVNTTYWITFDPSVKGRVWGVMSYVHDLPRPKMWRRTSPERYAGGVCISDDGGKTWRPSTEGMPPTAATHILLDPDSPTNARTLYVAGFGKGVFKSVDGGKTWTLRNQGLPEPEPFAWRLARDKNGVLYLVVARRSEDGNFGNAQDGALYRSRDGAEHWEKVTLPGGVNGPNGVSIDPQDPNRLYLAAWGRNLPPGAVDGGVYLSTDGGSSWRNVLAKDQHVYDVTIDPRNPRILYACGFESSAWRSTDGGETWTRIRGYNFKWGHRVIPDLQNPDLIYITTYGGSVWHGPAAGDPHAVEDIVTPALAYGQ